MKSLKITLKSFEYEPNIFSLVNVKVNFNFETHETKYVLMILVDTFDVTSLLHRVKSVRVRSYSGPYFPAIGLNTDQNNTEYGHFLRSVGFVSNINLNWRLSKTWLGYYSQIYRNRQTFYHVSCSFNQKRYATETRKLHAWFVVPCTISHRLQHLGNIRVPLFTAGFW